MAREREMPTGRALAVRREAPDHEGNLHLKAVGGDFNRRLGTLERATQALKDAGFDVFWEFKTNARSQFLNGVELRKM